MIIPRTYQKKAVNQVSILYGQGIRKILFQMPTGGGKTISFCYLIQRFLKLVQDQRILILVHRDILQEQTKKTLKKFDLSEDIISVEMIETAYNRLKKNKYYYGDIGLLIVDECHIGNFRKIYSLFEKSFIIGFTATPISAKKKHPLILDFEKIVCSTNIRGLIEQNHLCPNVTYHLKTINEKNLKKIAGDYSDKSQLSEFGKSYNVKNTVKAYEQKCKGKKTIIFNVNIEHSKLVNEAFLKAGYNSKHIDSYGEDNRDELWNWFQNTPDAILNNIGILTTGVDEPSIESVMVNKKTTSLTLWLQMCGRGGRPQEGKEYFTIIDLGGNALSHGDWSAVRDWEDIFYNPDKPSTGVAPVKNCEKCNAIISASATLCNFCGHLIPQEKKEVAYDVADVSLVRFTNNINIESIIKKNANYHKYRSLHVLKGVFVKRFKNITKSDYIDSDGIELLEGMFEVKVTEWCGRQGMKYNERIRSMSNKILNEEIEKQFEILVNL